MGVHDDISVNFYNIVTFTNGKCFIHNDTFFPAVIFMPDMFDGAWEVMLEIFNKKSGVHPRTIISYDYFSGN